MNPSTYGIVVLFTLLGIIAFVVDEKIYALWRMWGRTSKAYSLKELRSIVWKGPSSNPLSRRSVFNPSLLHEPERKRWLLLARYTRGRRLGQCTLQYLLDDDICMIRNEKYRASMRLYIFDDHFRCIREEPVFVNVLEGARDPLFWQGEDPRIFRDSDGRIRVQATLHGQYGEIKLGYGGIIRIDGRLVWEVDTVVKSQSPQKNWAPTPLTRGGRQIFLTHVSPRWVCATISPEGYPDYFFSTPSPGQLRGLRCTSPCVRFSENSFITCIHSVHPYKTYFLEIDAQTLEPLRMSAPLDFNPDVSYIEFASGLEIVGDNVFVGVGINDTRCEVHVLTKFDVDCLMQTSFPVNGDRDERQKKEPYADPVPKNEVEEHAVKGVPGPLV